MINTLAFVARSAGQATRKVEPFCLYVSETVASESKPTSCIGLSLRSDSLSPKIALLASRTFALCFWGKCKQSLKQVSFPFVSHQVDSLNEIAEQLSVEKQFVFIARKVGLFQDLKFDEVDIDFL